MNLTRNRVAKIAQHFLLLACLLLFEQCSYSDGATNDITPPAIAFLSPMDNQTIIKTTATTNILVSGTVRDESGVLKFRLFGSVEYPILLGCDTNGVCNFSHIFSLDPGMNTFVAEATDASANSNMASKTVHVFWGPPPPSPFFDGAPTSGEAPLTVTFTDSSGGGPITNRVADFGDGTIISYAGPASVVISNHTYTSAGLYTCALTVFGPGGSGTLTRTNYVRVVNPLAVTNALAMINSELVVLPDETVAFTVRETDLQGQALSYSWGFGDGETSTDSCPLHLFTNCGPHAVTVTASNAVSTISTGLIVSVACPFEELPKPTSLKMKSNFASGKLDTATLKTSMDLPAGFNAPNTPVTLQLAGVEIPFTLDAKGQAVNAFSSIKFSHKGTGTLWQVSAKLKGDFDAAWQNAGLTNATVTALPITVPVLLLFDISSPESFYMEKPLLYKATAGKSGTGQ